AIQAQVNKSEWGVGGDNRRIVESGTSLIQGLISGDVNKAVANASAPYIANYIGQHIEDDKGKIAAHGIANVALALAKGENAGAQSLGAMTAEAVGMLSEKLYNKPASQLTEDEKATVSAFASLAAGIAGGLVGGDTSSAGNAAQSGKTTVENNYLSDSEHRQKTSLELKEQQGKITEVEQQKLAELRIKDTETTQKLLDTCAGGVSPECTAARKDAFETIDTYVSLTYQNPKTAQAGYQEIERLLNSTSPEAQQAFNLLESYTEAFKNFGYSDEEARARAGTYVGSIYLLGGMSAIANSGALVKQFGKDVAKPNVKPEVTPPKNSETYFRVEGGGSGTKTSQNRINVNADGSVTINSGCSGQLCVSTNGPNHASYYLTNRRPDGSVVVFEVDASLHKQIMDAAIPQRPIPGIPRDPNAPKIVDPGKGDPSMSLELPKVWDKLIEQNSSKAKVLTKEEFLNEFGK
ncbi:VENN motif pre-toxin domain-containing protein, partial [Providencia huaxiensis]|uniref:VENN motif pre-toxin domain-containing protein n=1 Tax=Providencia huaxiensis TaxID=2027290 RepID=UPI0034E3B88B